MSGFIVENEDGSEVEATGHFNPSRKMRRLTQEEAAANRVAEPIDANLISRKVSPGANEDDFDWIERTGKNAKLLSADELRKRLVEQAGENKQIRAQNSGPNQEDLPVIKFPTLIDLLDSDLSGDVGGVSFKDGRGDGFHSYARCMSIAAAGFRIRDRVTEIEISPLSIGTTFMAEGQFWNSYQELPEHCTLIEEKTNGEIHQERKEGSSNQGPEEGHERRPQVKVIGAKTQEGEPLDGVKIKKLTALIPQLRPNHKEDWTGDLPDCNRLSVLLRGLYGSEGKLPDFKLKVTKAERDLAWSLFNRDKLNDDEMIDPNTAYQHPVTDDIEDVLEAVSKQNGLRVLRQFAESKGVERPPREKPDLIELLIGIGITKKEAQALI